MDPISVLILEDDDSHARTLWDAFDHWGHHAELHRDIASARSALLERPKHCDLVLADVHIGPHRSFDFLAETVLGRYPLVVMSATEVELPPCFNDALVPLLQKPLRLAVLKQGVARTLANWRRAQQ